MVKMTLPCGTHQPRNMYYDLSFGVISTIMLILSMGLVMMLLVMTIKLLDLYNSGEERWSILKLLSIV